MGPPRLDPEAPTASGDVTSFGGRIRLLDEGHLELVNFSQRMRSGKTEPHDRVEKWRKV